MWIVADVVFDSDETAREAERLATEGKLAGVSADLGNVSIELEILDQDENDIPTDWTETVTSGEILGATQVAMPAFADARIELVDGRLLAFLVPEGALTSDRRTIAPGALVWRENAPLMFNDTSDGHDGAVHVGNLVNFRRLALVASEVPLTPPALRGLTKPVVSEGFIKGHGAGWGTCHTGFKNACVTAPSSSYSEVVEGVGIYRHPLGDIHAPLHLNATEAKSWYERYCERVSTSAVGEDDYGIWVNGETDLEDGELFLSGDWREVDGQLELISFLVVENPGFPTAMVASEHQTSLTAAGIVTQTEDNRLARLEAKVAELEFDLEARKLLDQLL